MNELKPFVNRDGQLPEGGWIHLVPKGEFPITTYVKDQPVTEMQVLDDAACQSIVNRFKEDAKAPNFAGVRMDFEHFSYDNTKSSEASGWIKDMQVREDGIWANVEWSDLGETAVKNKRYKFLSPVWMGKDTEQLGKNRFRPLRLDSAGLTNNPNLRGMVPLTNRAEAGASAETTQTNNPKQNMDKIAQELGLPATATVEEIVAAIQKLKNPDATGDTPMANRVKALEADNKKLREAQVETDLAPLKNRVTDEQMQSFRQGLLTNREAVLPAVTALNASLPAAKTDKDGKPIIQDPITNRATAKTPEGTPSGEDNKEHPFLNRAKKMAEDGKIDFATASEKLAKEDPKLFQSYMDDLHKVKE